MLQPENQAKNTYICLPALKQENQDPSVSTRICMDQATDSQVDRQHHQGIPHWDLHLLGNK